MMEHIREEQLALYATGDLAAKDASVVAAHMQDCETCQAAIAGFREVQGFVAAALIDPAADELFEVRERVSAKLRERPAGRLQWAGWAAAAAVAVVALILIGVEYKPPITPKPAPAVAQLKPPEVPRLEIPQLRTAVLHKRRVRHREAGLRSVDLIARADQPPVIKMTTTDPNVVILWQSNEGVKNE